MGSARGGFLEAWQDNRAKCAPGVQEERWLCSPEEENNCTKGGQGARQYERRLYKSRAR